MWDLKEAILYYKNQGAPRDQAALVALLREVQDAHEGAIPQGLLPMLAEEFGVRESFLLAVIKKLPSLRLADTHLLELCAGVNCAKQQALAAQAESLQKAHPGKITLQYTGCMRMCGKGPNLKWDGKLYHRADPELLEKLTESL